MSVQGRKKSEFPALTGITSGSYFDFVINGINYRIKDSDFYAALGVTGTIVQDGDPLGTPILDIQGTVNNIRNLEVDSDSGIAASVSAVNGVYLELDAQTGGTGVAILNSANHIRKILAGSGIGVTLSGDDIVISVTSVPSAKRGVVRMVGNAVATALAVGVPSIISGTWTKVEESLFTANTAGRLTYTGTSTLNALIQANLDVTKALAGADTYEIEVYKNGVATGYRTKFATDANWSTSIMGVLQLTTNDYLELYANNTTSGNDITLNDGTFQVLG